MFSQIMIINNNRDRYQHQYGYYEAQRDIRYGKNFYFFFQFGKFKINYCSVLFDWNFLYEIPIT